jgi:hypothetical protein
LFTHSNLPENRIFLTENYYRNAKEMKNTANPIKGRKVTDYMSGPVRCFEHTIGKYVLPRMLIKADGEVRTCACFNPPEELKIGNIREMTVHEILEQINQNEIVSIIAENGLHHFCGFLSEDLYTDLSCENECDACRILISLYKKQKGKERSHPYSEIK